MAFTNIFGNWFLKIEKQNKQVAKNKQKHLHKYMHLVNNTEYHCMMHLSIITLFTFSSHTLLCHFLEKKNKVKVILKIQSNTA